MLDKRLFTFYLASSIIVSMKRHDVSHKWLNYSYIDTTFTIKGRMTRFPHAMLVVNNSAYMCIDRIWPGAITNQMKSFGKTNIKPLGLGKILFV